jgi:hypothetical protein
MQLSFLEPIVKDDKPTINSVPIGQVFRRIKAPRYARFLYMRVDICGDIKHELKDYPVRDRVIMNLETGSVFTVNGSEEIMPLPNASVIEDSTVQLIHTVSAKQRRR